MNIDRSFYIPTGARVVYLDGADAVAYIYEVSGACYGLGFRGKVQKPSFHYRFRNEDARTAHINKWADDLMAVKAYKAERTAKRKAFKHSLKVGDILKSVWGYDQTNVDFYQVIDVRGTCVVIREISQDSEDTGYLQGVCVPVPNAFVGEPMRKRVGEGNSVRVSRSGRHASPVEVIEVGGVKCFAPSFWSSYA